MKAAGSAGARAALALTIMAASAGAQTTPTVVVTGPASNPITDAVGTFSVHARGFAAADLPIRVQLQVSTSVDFNNSALFADTTVNDTLVVITIPRLLPGSGVLYWRAFALTARAGSVPSVVTGPRTAPTHLRLISPNNPAGQSLDTSRPTFVWQSSTVPVTFGRWDYELRVESTATGRPVLISSTDDTTLTVADDLETNASYRWRVRARLLPTHESVEVASAATFVIRSSNAPLATLLYRPFPNPFPSARSPSACIWFDLRTASTVTLDVLDLNGHRVRRLVPGPGVTNPLPPGRYGRPPQGNAGGCDDRFAWDGTDERGRVVNAGLYVIRLDVGGRAYYERTLFAGR